MQVDHAWEIEIAAMLSQVGCITIPETTLAKLSSGAPVSVEERRAYQGHPRVGCNLISKIPRLQGVAEIIACQQKRFDGSGVPNDGKKADQIPFGGRVLKLVIDVVQLISTEQSTDDVWAAVHAREGWYDPSVVDALAAVLDVEYVIKSVEIKQLEENMTLDEHVMTRSGSLLLARGHEVTSSLRERLTALAATSRGVREPIRVRCPISRAEANQIETLERDLAPDAGGIEI
jgi:response regulator RpfG family c-di-GMP phosphodiesterase